MDVGVEPLSIELREPVSGAFIDLEFGILDDLDALGGGRGKWDDLVVRAVNDQCRLVDFLEVFGVVDFRELVNAIVLALDAAREALGGGSFPGDPDFPSRPRG